MNAAAEKSFEIRTAREYLEELLRPAHAEFTKDALSSRKAIACAIFAWHLRDWVWAQHKAELQANLGFKGIRNFDHFLFANCPELEVVKEVANGSKHFKGGGSTVAGTKLAHGFPSGLLLLLTQSHLVIDTGTATHFAENLLSKVLGYWDNFFAQHLTP